jgi:hypothetical protein
LGSGPNDATAAPDVAPAARPNRKAERASAVAQNFIWREQHVGKDGVALVDGTMTRTTPQVGARLSSRRNFAPFQVDTYLFAFSYPTTDDAPNIY